MTALTAITQIVPRLPPAVDGVGDYASVLASRLRSDMAIESRFLVTDPHCLSPEGSLRLPRQTGRALADLLGTSQTVLLHFVNYAYQQRGCPWWLVHGLERWRHAQPERRLLVMFHELYAFAPPWSSAFWLSPIQRMIARRLFRLADGSLTSLEQYGRWLWGEERPGSTWPVFSNIGEPTQVPALAQRDAAVVVFGRSHARQRIYRDNADLLRSVAKRLSLRTLHDIGSSLPAGTIPALDGLRVVEHGVLPAERISGILLDARICLMNNGDKPLGKSGVFAACSSHGVVVLSSMPYPEADGLANQRDYLSDGVVDPERMQIIADSALAWYSGHDSHHLAEAVARLVHHHHSAPSGV